MKNGKTQRNVCPQIRLDRSRPTTNLRIPTILHKQFMNK